MNSKRKRISIYTRDDVTVVDLGEMEIWDGADLALLRETLTQLTDIKKQKSIGVELSFVKYIPSGFFGMLYDLHEKGIGIQVYHPQPNVARMLWFRQFFTEAEPGTYLLGSEPKFELTPPLPGYRSTSIWETETNGAPINGNNGYERMTHPARVSEPSSAMRNL